MNRGGRKGGSKGEGPLWAWGATEGNTPYATESDNAGRIETKTIWDSLSDNY